MHPELSNLQWLEYIKIYGSQPGLQTVKLLLKLLGYPQTSFESIHVTGTNGKGSTVAMTASIFRAAGYKTGMFTSPHLSVINESIKVNEQNISVSAMDTYIGVIREKIDVLEAQGIRHPTHFEVLVALAYTYFAAEEIDIAVVEVGMGGRDDATNVIDSITSIVTNISLEHTQWLGDTIEEIAENKAGILKKNSVLITAATQPSVISKLAEIAKQKQSALIQIRKDYEIIPETKSLQGQEFTVRTPTKTLRHLRIPLLGDHQLRNATCAIAAIEAAQSRDYQITIDDFREGFAAVAWPGRFEIVEKNPLTVLDGAKDAQAIKALVKTVKQYLPDKRVYTIIGISSDKDHESMIKSLSEITYQFIITEHRVQNRTARATDLEKIAQKTGKPTNIIIPVRKAMDETRKHVKQDDVILVTGSVFLIGEARENWYPPIPATPGKSYEP